MQTALTSPRWVRRALIWVGLALLAVVALWFASRIPRTLTVFTIAAFIAFGVNPIVRWLEQRMPRTVAILAVYTGLIAIIVVLSLLVLPAVIAQVQQLAVNSPDYITTLQNWVDAVQTWLHDRLGHTAAALIPPGYGDLKTLLAAKMTTWFTASLTSLSAILIDTFTAAFIGVSAVVLSSFFVFRGEHVADAIYDIFPARRRTNARALGRQLADVFGAYVSGQLALCTICGALIFAGTAFTGFKFALLLGIVSGIAYAVPFVGQIFAHSVAILLAAPQGGKMVIVVNVIVFVVARIMDNLLVPKIMSESVGVSPIVVMFAVFAGGELFGLPGLLLGIPVAALIKVAWEFFRSGGFGAVESGVRAEGHATRKAAPAPSTQAHSPREA